MLPLSNLALNTECPKGHSVLDYMDALGLTLAMASNSGLKPYASHGFGGAVSNACSGFTFAIIHITAAYVGFDSQRSFLSNIYFTVTPYMTGSIQIIGQLYSSNSPAQLSPSGVRFGEIATTHIITITIDNYCSIYGSITAYK